MEYSPSGKIYGRGEVELQQNTPLPDLDTAKNSLLDHWGEGLAVRVCGT